MMRTYSLLVFLASVVPEIVSGQAGVAGTLMCRLTRHGPDYAGLRYGIVYFVDYPETKQLVSESGGFILEWPGRNANSRRGESMLLLGVQGGLRDVVGAPINRANTRRYFKDSLFRLGKIKSDSTCDAIDLSLAAAAQLNQQWETISAKMQAGSHVRAAIRTTAAVVSELGVSVLAVSSVNSQSVRTEPSTAIDADANEVLLFGAAPSLTDYAYTEATAQQGFRATATRDVSDAMQWNIASIEPYQDAQVWIQTSGRGFARATAIKPLGKYMVVAGELQSLKQFSGTRIALSVDSAIATPLNIRQTNALIGFSFRPMWNFGLGVAAHYDDARSTRFLQVVSTSNFRLTSGLKKGPTTLSTTPGAAHQAGIDVGANAYVLPNLSVGLASISRSRLPTDGNALVTSRAIIGGTSAELGRLYIGADFSHEMDRNAESLGTSFRMTNTSYVHVGVGSDHSWSAGIELEPVVVSIHKASGFGTEASVAFAHIFPSAPTSTR